MNIVLFVKIIAWIISVLSTVVCLNAIRLKLNYSKTDELLDKLHHTERIFLIGRYFWIAVIAWTVLISMK